MSVEGSAMKPEGHCATHNLIFAEFDDAPLYL